MPFDLSVTISMHFYERCQTKRDGGGGGGGGGDRQTWDEESPFSNLKFQTSLFVWGGVGGGGEDYSYIFMHT